MKQGTGIEGVGIEQQDFVGSGILRGGERLLPHGKTGAQGVEVSGKGRVLLSASRLQLFGDIEKWLM